MKLQKLARRLMTKNLRYSKAKTGTIEKAPRLNLLELEDRSVPAVFFVSTTGSDSNLGTAAQPFRSIGAAITAASATVDGNDTVNVAGGVYNNATFDTRFDIGNTASPPAGLLNLQLFGGWNAAFTLRNPAATPTDYTFTNSPAANRYDIQILHPSTTIDGFTFRSSDGTNPRNADTILATVPDAVVSNNTIYTGIRDGGGARPTGVVAGTNNDYTGLQVLNNTILVNFSGTPVNGTASVGVFLGSTSTTTSALVSGNTITGNNMNSGVIVSGVNNAVIQGNTINRSTPLFGAGIELRNNILGVNNASLLDNTILDTSLSASNSAIGIQLGQSGGANAAVTNTVVRGNLVSMAGPSTTGLFAGTGAVAASTLIERNSLVSARAGGSVVANVAGLDVSGNWLGSASPATINAAISATGPGSIVARSFLSSGADDSAAAGLQLPPTTEMLVPQTFATAGIAKIDGRIQSGVDRAAAGMTVRVAADTYSGGNIVNKSLTIVGTGTPTVTTGDFLDGYGGAFEVKANNVTIDGFNLLGNNTSTTPNFYGVILLNGYNGATIQNNTIANFEKSAIQGEDGATGQSNVLIQGNSFGNSVDGDFAVTILSGSNWTVQNNSFTAGNSGVIAQSQLSGPVSNVNVTNNTFTGGYNSFIAADASNVQFTNNTVTNPLATAVYAGGGVNGMTVTGNQITGGAYNGVGIRSDFAGSGTPNNNLNVSNNIITGNAVGVNIFDNASLTSVASLTLGNNNISGNTTGLENDSTWALVATSNWWGSATGPRGTLNTYNDGTGDLVTGPATVARWLASGTDTLPLVPGFQPSSVLFAPISNNEGEYYSTFASAVAGTNAGGTITAANGLYKESNTTLLRPVTIIGQSRAGVVVAPAAEDSNINSSFGGVSQHGFIVQADNVTIRDLTIDGEGNTLLTPGKNNFRTGIITQLNTVVNNLTVQNVHVENIFRRGIQVSYTGTGNVITGSTIESVNGLSTSYGIIAFDGSVAITNNVLADNSQAIAANRSDYGPGGAYPLLTIQGNQITGSSIGLYISAAASGSIIGGATASLGNTISTVGGANDDVGMIVTYTNGAMTIQNNQVTVSGGDSAIWLGSNEDSLNPVMILNNTLTTTGSTSPTPGQGAGIFLTDDRNIFNGGFGVDAAIYTTIRGNTITGFQTGIDLYQTATINGGPKPLVASIGGPLAADANAISGSGVAGIRVQGALASATIAGNAGVGSITGNAIGIDVDGGSATITTNDIASNVIGVRAANGGTATLNNNFIRTNSGDGLLITASAGTLGTISANDLSGNGGFAVNNLSAQTVNASSNWWGSSVLATVSAERNGTVDYTPYLSLGTDTSASPGFQGDFSNLVVHTAGAQVSAAGRITEGYDSLSAAGTIHVLTGTYTENVDLGAGSNKAVNLEAGASPGVVTINGNLTLTSNDTLTVDIAGSGAGQYDQLVVNGTVSLGGSKLVLNQTVAPSLAAVLTLVNNDDTDAVAGTFTGTIAGLPEGATVVAGGTSYTISYVGGTGNDVTLTRNLPPTNLILSNNTIAENAGLNILVGTFSTTDPDSGDGDAFTYTFVGSGGDYDLFTLDSSTGQLRAVDSFDFETPPTSYTLQVRSTDLSGFSIVKSFTINVLDVNDVPTFILSNGLGVDENSPVGTVVGSVFGIDPDTTAPNNTLTYGFADGLGGTSLTSPDGLFAINPVTGVITVNSATLNFEALDPLNANYQYYIRATDGPGLYVESPFAIGINNVNEAPSNLATTGLSVAENSPALTPVGSVTSIDPDTIASGFGTLTYSLTSNPGGLFAINSSNGQITTTAPLNFETNPTYSITVQVTDGTNSNSNTFTVNVTNVNEAPTALQLSNTTLPENAGVVTVGTLTTTDPDAGDTFSYTLVAGGPDNGSFDIVGNQLVTRGSFNFEFQNVFQINVRTLDSGGLSFTQPFTITVTNVNEAPTNINATALTVAENSTTSTFVGTATGIDPDTVAPFNTLTYSLTIDASGRFTIDSTTGAITVANGTLLDFETSTSHSITVLVTDGGGLTFSKAFTVSVTNVNEAPTDITGTLTVPENSANGTAVGTATGVDPDNVAPFNTLSYVLLTNASGRFAINSSTGAITVANGSLLDFEANASHSITVQVTDGGGLTFIKALTVTVTNVNEAPTDIVATTLTVPENSATNAIVGTATGVDPDTSAPFNTLGYSLTDTAGGRFQINSASGVITVANGALLNFEANTSHSITVQVTDGGGLTFSKAFTVTVTDVNEAPTDILPTTLTVPENSATNTIVGTATGIDPDNSAPFNSLSYSLTDTAGGRFQINSATGVITVANGALLNYEANTSHSITVQVTDGGGLTFSKAFTVTVTDVNEAPTDITTTALTIPENSVNGSLVGTATGVDPDAGSTFTYSLLDNAGGRFAINSLNGIISVSNGPLLNYEANASHPITILVTDNGGLTFSKAFTVTVTDVNEGPTNITTTPLTVPENSANGTAVGTATGVDPDTTAPFNTLTYSLLDNAGGRFAINLSTGAITVANGTLLDFEANTSHSITVQVTDSGNLTFSKVFTVAVTNVNEAPTDITTTPLTVPENSPAGTPVGTATGYDVDVPTTFTYTLTNNPGGLFAINPTTGVITTTAPLNFETNPAPSITIRVSDGSLTYSEAFTVTVTDVNEAPTAILLSSNSVPENTPNGVIGTLSSFGDPDAPPQSYTYTLVSGIGDDDNLLFNINPANNRLRTTNALDFETKNTYTVRVRSTDQGGAFVEQSFVVNVTNLNEGPTNNVPGVQTVNEDTPLAFNGAKTISVSDLEGATATVQLTVTNGTLTVSLAGGAAISAGANGSSTLTLMGNQAKINAALATLTYLGSPDYYGSDTLTIFSKDTDAIPQTDTDSVAIAILPVADVLNDNLLLNGLNTVTANLITGTNGASADTFSNPGRTLVSVSSPSKGTVTFAANGTINYTPNFVFTGSDTFTYTVTSAGKSETGTVTVGGPSQSTFLTSSSISGQPVRQYSVSGTGAPAVATGLSFAITGAAKVAYADVNGDGTEDVIVGTVNGSTSLVTIYNGRTAAFMNSFTPFVAGSVSAIYVAAGDVNGDGKADVTVSNGSVSPGANSNLRIYDGAYIASGKAVVSASVGGTVAAQGRLRDIYGLSNTTASSGNGTTFTANTGATVAMGDFNGDGLADIVVGTANGGTSRVVIYDAKVLLGSNGTTAWPKPNVDLRVYDNGNSTGVSVAAGDVNGDGRAELITGALSGGANIRVFTFAAGSKALPTSSYATFTNGPGTITTTTISGTAPTLSADFLVGATNAGVRVAARDLNNDGYADILYTFATNAGGPSTAVATVDGNTLRTTYASSPYQLQTAPPPGSAYTLLTAAYAGVSTGAYVA